MRVNLKVPFAEKDAAKKLGARWDAARKIWYVEKTGDLAPFAKWAPTPHDASIAGDTPATSLSSTRPPSNGKVFVGSKYVKHSPVCTCLPWETCAQCQTTALNA